MRSFALASLAAAAGTALAKDWQGAAYPATSLFQYPVPVPPVKVPVKSYDYPGRPSIDYYEVDIKPVSKQLMPGLGATRLVGYDGEVPGPTFMMKQGREAVVRFINHGDRANSVHLHGSYSRAPFDGWAEDTTEPGQYKDYYYPNAQAARTLWYHDHAIDHTAENAYFGQAGFYILHDDEELAVPGLPQGKYDIPLALSAKQYNNDGSLWDPEANGETTSIYGDVIHVNGQPWPYLNVEPRKYRFRFLNAAVSRTFQMSFQPDGGSQKGVRQTFNVVGSDAGLLTGPVSSTQLDISMAERWEVVVDFSQFAGQNITLKNNADVGADTQYIYTDRIMRFVVGQTVTDTSKNEALPSTLRNVAFPPSKAGIDRSFRFERTNGEWKINGASWADGPEARVLAKPPRGKVEVWELENSSGGWTHPIHIHLVDFQVISRTGGRNQVLPYEKAALKDVVWLGTNEKVTVIARYAPWDGVYMFHCHNLIHEDHEMMAAMNITALTDLGYDEKTRFIDPMESKYRSVNFAAADQSGRSGDFSDDKIYQKCNDFANMEAYIHAGEAEEKLVAYWSTHTVSSTVTSTTVASTSTTAAVVVTTAASTSTTAAAAATTPSTLTTSTKAASITTTTKAASTSSTKASSTSSAKASTSSKKKRRARRTAAAAA